jgi:hypothetical protein
MWARFPERAGIFCGTHHIRNHGRLVLDCESAKETQQGKTGEGELQEGIEIGTKRKEEKIMEKNT